MRLATSTTETLTDLTTDLVMANNNNLPPVHVMAYTVDYTTITSTHTGTSAAKKYIQPYIQKVFAWTKQNNLILNPDKTTCTLFTPDPAEYMCTLDIKIHNNALPMATHPKVLGSYRRPKTHIQHTHPQHLSTRTQTSIWSIPLPYGCIFDQH